MRRLLLVGLLSLGASAQLKAQVPGPAPLSAQAELKDSSGQVLGLVNLLQLPQGTEVSVEVRGFTPGQHAVHFHEFGRCTPGIDPATNQQVPFGGAGGHFDPGQSKNHDGPQTLNTHGHAGDSPMLEVGPSGLGRLAFNTRKISLAGPEGVLGRSLVVHAQPDDFQSDPAGKSGARVLCGVVNRLNLTVRDYPLPSPLAYPEGVAYDPQRGVLYTGSAANGNIYALNPQSGQVKLFSEGGTPGRAAAFGLKVDRQGRLWVAGGPQGTISILRPDGMLERVLETPPSPRPFVNDLAFAPDGSAYITDSARPVLYRVSPAGQLSAWLDLKGTAIRYQAGLNLNGIVATPDGRALLTVQLNTGELWRIDLRSKAVRKVLSGLKHGDGLLLKGRDLYVARNKAQLISKVRLNADYNTGRLVAEEPLAGLRFPATLAQLGNDLVVTQAQLDKLQGGLPQTPFVLTRFKAF